jgi:hypothetical protein
MAPLILNFGTSWRGVDQLKSRQLYPWEGTPILEQQARWGPKPALTSWEKKKIQCL